jgi:hypothetical protein
MSPKSGKRPSAFQQVSKDKIRIANKEKSSRRSLSTGCTQPSGKLVGRMSGEGVVSIADSSSITGACGDSPIT